MSDDSSKQEVTVVDVKMPFLSMVVFLIKLALAAIPAMIILSFIFMALSMVFGGMFYGIVGHGRY